MVHCSPSRVSCFSQLYCCKLHCSIDVHVHFSSYRSSWETSFKEKSEVISTVEMVCCRRIVELCQQMVAVAYHYHHCINCPQQAKQKR